MAFSDEYWMRRALVLARRALGRTYPNPLVGAVVVDASGKKIGEGFHEKAGGPHAEIHALAQAGEKARGGTLYVTLEPCSFQGQTPPCTNAIIRSGVRRVVAAVQDPNPRVSGEGFRELRSAGIDVVETCEARAAIRMNQPFFKWMKECKPFVTAKVALTPGMVMGHSERRLLISHPMMEQTTMKLRARAGALIVGAQTVLTDDPRLTIRGRWAHPGMIRVIFDPRLKTPVNANIFESPGPVWIVHRTLESREAEAQRARLSTQATLIDLGGLSEAEMAPRILERLLKSGVYAVIIEGGPRTLGLFHRANLIDAWVIYLRREELKGAGDPSKLVTLDLRPPLHLSVESVIKRAHDLEVVAKHVHRDH